MTRKTTHTRLGQDTLGMYRSDKRFPRETDDDIFKRVIYERDQFRRVVLGKNK